MATRPGQRAPRGPRIRLAREDGQGRALSAAWLTALQTMQAAELAVLANYLNNGGDIPGLRVTDVMFELEFRFLGPHP